MEYAGLTALITGASSGIGAEYARALAARGANLVLVARRRDRLDDLRHELSAAHGVTVTVADMDLARPKAVEDLRRNLIGKGITVDVLINNAGFGLNTRFVNEDATRTQEEIQLNVAVLVDLTSTYLREMVARNSGVIVNIASTASFQPVPGMAVYGATKSFVRSFTEAVWGELRDTDVQVLAVNPGATESEFFEVAGGKPSGRAVPASRVVEATLRELDRTKPKPSIVVGAGNRLAAAFASVMPRRFVIKTVARMFLPPA